MHRERLIVFLKAPRAGEVKTRLAQTIGTEGAAHAYAQLIDILLQNLNEIAAVELRVTPDNAEGQFKKWLKPGWSLGRQGEGGLTEKLQWAFSDAFATGFSRVVVIGSDCPDVTVEDIQTAWEALRVNDLVLGPATDGGYWLIGLRRPLPEIFTNIPWSTEGVLEKTLAIARTLGVKTQLLRTLNDVDTFADWERFQRSRGLNVAGGLFDSGAAEPR